VAVKAAHFARPPGLGLDGREHGDNIRVRRGSKYSIRTLQNADEKHGASTDFFCRCTWYLIPSYIYPDSLKTREKFLVFFGLTDSAQGMIRGGFLTEEDRGKLVALVRDGSAASRVTRRANALVLLDGGWSCQEVAAALLMDDDTIRGWHKLFEQRGIEGLTSFDMGGSAGFLSTAQEDALKAYVGATLPRSTRQVGAWIEQEFGLVYESRSGLIALLHRLGLEYHKPNVIPTKLDEDKQKTFIENYEKLLNSLGDDEAVLFADAVHPTHAARPAGCWAPKQEKLAIEQTSGRDRINIHGAIDLATGQTRMIEVVTVDAVSTIRLLESIEALYPLLVLIHVFLDNARYHHARLVQEWLARPGCRIKLHFIPSYCPHLNPIERLWGLMHRNVTHNKCYATCAQFADATLSFLREKVPRNWADLCDSVTDNFRVINPKEFRVMR
jgi:transposase